MDGDCQVPSSLVPRCPVCAGPMTMNLRSNSRFVQDEEWYRCQDRYHTFMQQIGIQSAALLELGVGFNTPGIIRLPFEPMICTSRNKTLIRINRDHPFGPEENRDKTISFSEDMTTTADALLESPGKHPLPDLFQSDIRMTYLLALKQAMIFQKKENSIFTF